MAWFSVHTALSESRQTMRKQVAWLFRKAGLVQNGLVFPMFTHLLLANRAESFRAKPRYHACVNEVLVFR